MSPASARSLARLALLPLAAVLLVAVSGVVVGLTYTGLEPAVRAAGLTLQHLRPFHETCAFAWVFLGGVTIIHLHLLRDGGDFTRGERLRFRAYVTLWALAGTGILASFLLGRFSGREYAGYPPVFSAMIAGGWLLFAWNFFGRMGFNLRGRPAYVYMWWVAVPLFLVTYAENHAYLLEWISRRPVRDLAIQWKANGSHVGSFNLLAYGSLMYVACRMKGDESYAHSNTAFALFFVGLLNTFTNYGHHTYHLPQSWIVHVTSFSISMLEIVILAKVFVDLLGGLRPEKTAPDLQVASRFAWSAGLWTFLMLAGALLISVPPLNTMIHGTHLVVAHSMGTMIGIDTMILLAAFAFLLREVRGADDRVVHGRLLRPLQPVLDTALLVLLVALAARGIAEGWVRYAGAGAPDFSAVIAGFPPAMTAAGLVLAAVVAATAGAWLVALAAAARGAPAGAEADVRPAPAGGHAGAGGQAAGAGGPAAAPDGGAGD